jgi:voltage-gated potassium channel
MEKRFVSKSPSPVRAASYIAAAALGISVFAGVLASWIDDGIDSVWDGMFWAVQTVTTVGYGSPLPTGTNGQVLAVLLMLFGTAFLAVITAAITSVFIERAHALREAEAEMDAAVGDEADDDPRAMLEEIVRRLDRLERALDTR